MQQVARSPSAQTTRNHPSAQPRARVLANAGLFGISLPFLKAGPPKPSKAEARAEAKKELLDRIATLDRGASATADDKADVERLASTLEDLNPTAKPLAAPELLSGKWRLLYTTSASILATNRPPFLRPQGPIYQTIDAERLKARNNESFPFYNQVTADLTPLTSSKVTVQFKTFTLFKLINITAPPAAKGELAVTYLDEDLRISRGDKGNLFVLDMADRAARLEGQ
ncbi:hypothetical protein CHLRE_03g188650v5 [Chlamydomonas reinhardtii]|uniref:Plastid lipid-associated protein/fibrillin conserved domain-containing protein n=1 Tax=Chlamydomonas reinhardtii TaxID=3055 RepID=A0A2K3DY62_CHLRE|nr:uncharacterized protein CHLRE_03g188650v5 [Chlamydomonas reinhardtii]PNW85484.1 hypothetical protein CHLRE_03g188650v5 [Chlamydomonas reinhardtii]